MRLLAAFLFVDTVLGAAQFDVIRKKPLWLDQAGTLRVEDSQICFTPAGDDEERRCWAYGADIQHLDRVSPTELALLSYEDVAWKLGRDRLYRFELVGGELSDDLFAEMAARIGRPVTDRVPPDAADSDLGIPAKRLRTFGGSEGAVYLSPERIVYRTDAESESREWRLDREVASVWASDPYRLEIHVYEGNSGSFRQPERYKFALKEPLDPETYRRLKLRLYEIDRERDLSP